MGSYLTASDIAEDLQVSRAQAYRLMREMLRPRPMTGRRGGSEIFVWALLIVR